MKLLAYFKTELTLSFPCKMRSTLFSFSLSLNWSCGNSAFIKQNTLNFIFIKFAKFSNALMIPVYHISLTKILNFPNHCQRKGKKKWKRRRKKGKYKVCLCVCILPFLAPFSGLPGILQAPALQLVCYSLCSSEEPLPGSLESNRCWCYHVWFLETQYHRIWKSQKVTAFIFSFNETCHLFQKGFWFCFCFPLW